jgi:DnaJ-class molecular chaperone
VRNPYDILHVSKNATDSEIKQSYRRLAKAHHPDSNKKDPNAADTFAQINAAYEILGDKKKRKQFDQGEIDAEGKPRFSQSHPQNNSEGFSFHFNEDPSSFFRQKSRTQSSFESGDFFNLEDLLGASLGRGFQSQRSQGKTPFPQDRVPSPIDITISLETAFHGGTQRLTLSDRRTIDVAIPKGVLEGQIIRIQGGASNKLGDLLLKVHIAPHKHFTVENSDLLVRVPVSLEEAVLGGKIRIPTLDKDVFMTIPPMTSSTKSFRLKGKGLISKGQAGSIIVAIDIQLPDKDPELEALMKRRHKNTE